MLCLAGANATTILVLEITSVNNEMDLAIDETKFLTDELRRQAMQFLPKDYFVLTRDKIISITPKSAENLTSVIDIGIALKSDYVTRSFIGKLGNMFTLTVELYEVSSGDMLGDFVKESMDLKGLLEAIRERAPNLFAKIIAREKLNQTNSKISTNIPAEPKNTKTPLWVAIGLDVLGATALGLGVYNNIKAGNYYEESKDLLENIVPKQYDNIRNSFDTKYKKMKNDEKARNIFYAVGSIMLLGGITVHIWF
jgi:hypothetical protein